MEWTKSLKLAGKNYYFGVVDDVEDILEQHKRTTLCTFSTRTSVKCAKENQPPGSSFSKVS